MGIINQPKENKMNIMKLLSVRHGFYEEYPFLGAKDLHLLECIAIHENNGSPLSVMDAMKLNVVASPASVHRFIDRLEFYELIQRKYTYDLRTKRLVLDNAGKKYFTRLERFLGKTK